MANLVVPPYEVFTDANGDPLEDGFIFIGEPGLSPITNPLQAFFDSDLTIPANDIRTKGGYPANSGSPARLYTATNYSIVVQDKNGRTLYTQLDSVDYINSASGSLIALVNTIADLRGLALANPNDQASVGGSVTVGDGLMGPLYYWNATSSAVDNGVSIIKPTSTSGNGRWLWINTNAPMEVVNITATGTLTLNFMNRIFLVNNPLAAVLAVPDGDFQGQEIQVANRAVSTVQITGTGIPSSTFIAEEVLLTWLGTQWSISWKSSTIVTADSVDTAVSTAVRGYSSVSLSEYNTDLAPDVKVGSVFETNGGVVSVSGSDITPTGYSGVTVDTAFYLYYDDSGSTFIFDETAPVWEDALQGWYNGADRALFSMFKDVGGTLYQDKNLLVAQNNFSFSNVLEAESLKANTITAKEIPVQVYSGNSVSEGTIFTAIEGSLEEGIVYKCNGSATLSASPSSSDPLIIATIEKNTATQITLNGLLLIFTSGALAGTDSTTDINLNSGGGTLYNIYISF